jgi:hypothetical protein
VGTGANYGFLRTTRRHEEEQRRFLDRLRTEPELRREYRTSLLIQVIIVGILVAAILGLIVQSLAFLRGLHAATAARALWAIPAVAALLAVIAARRFLALLANYRHMRDQ